MDRRPCTCLRFGTIKAGEGGIEAGQVGPPEEGLSGFEAGRCVLPRRTRWASIERFVTCPGALFAGRHRCLTSLAVYGVLRDCWGE